MFIIQSGDNGATCETTSDANAIITSMFALAPHATIKCELLDDDNEPLSYWTFTNGDALIPNDAQP